MSLKKVLISTVAAATLTSGLSAAINVEPSHVGNNLKFPAYYAIESAGWYTKIKIANTNINSSIVAKLVLRESTRSVEKLDILLYLSPTDVFTADIREENGKVVLATVDDSHNLDVNDPSGRVTLNAAGETVVTFADAITVDERVQNNQFGYIEVYGLMESNQSDVNYSTSACNSGSVTFTKAGGVSGITCTPVTAGKNVALNAAGVDHSKFVLAALTDYNATAMTNYGWTEVSGGLTGEAVILSNNANGHLAMAYQAVALDNNTSNNTAVGFDALTAAAQRGQDTNLLVYNDASFIQSLEDGIMKDRTFVFHSAKDGRLPTQAANTGDMAETRLLANFVTKKYSVESRAYLGSTPYPTYGVNVAGGNLFNIEACTTTGATTNVCGRNVTITASGHDHYEAHTTAAPGSGVSGGNPGAPAQTRTDNNEIVSIDVRNDSPYADGYVEYAFAGRLQRDTANNAAVLSAMPYLPMVMSAVTFTDGTNVTNIKFPAYRAATIDRNATGLFLSLNNVVQATQYADANNTGYDITTAQDGKLK